MPYYLNFLSCFLILIGDDYNNVYMVGFFLLFLKKGKLKFCRLSLGTDF